MRKIVVLGATGSIGKQALDVARRSGELKLVGLAAAESWERLLAQAVEHGVTRVALADPQAAVSAAEAWSGGEVLAGDEGMMRLVVESGADLVLNGLVGSAGLGPTVATLGELHDELAADHEALLVGEREVHALAERRHGGPEPGGADEAVQDEIGAGLHD